MQFSDGIFRFKEWIDAFTAHILAGPGTIQGLQEVSLNPQISGY